MFKHSGRPRVGAKVGALSTTTLDQAVDKAEESYHAFRLKLRALIATLRTHHDMMLKMNESQMESIKAVCELLINTPVSRCVIGTDHAQEHDPPAEEERKPLDDEQHELSKVSTTSTRGSNHRPEKQPIGLESGRRSIGGTASARDMGFHSFHSVLGGQGTSDLNESFMGLFNDSNELNRLYARRYLDWIVGYLEEWETIVSTR